MRHAPHEIGDVGERQRLFDAPCEIGTDAAHLCNTESHGESARRCAVDEERGARTGCIEIGGAHDDAVTTRIAHEVMRFRALGLSPVEALATATSGAAELLGIASRTGRVAAGLEADLIVLEANPLEDPMALQDVLVVITDGRVVLNRTPFGRQGAR